MMLISPLTAVLGGRQQQCPADDAHRPFAPRADVMRGRNASMSSLCAPRQHRSADHRDRQQQVEHRDLAGDDRRCSSSTVAKTGFFITPVRFAIAFDAGERQHDEDEGLPHVQRRVTAQVPHVQVRQSICGSAKPTTSSVMIIIPMRAKIA
jgi:hypothetical protein